MGLITRIKTWATGGQLTAAALNAEFDNIITVYNADLQKFYYRGFSEATVLGKCYYVTDAGALALADASSTNLWGRLYGLGTGNTGEILWYGKLTDLTNMSAGVQFLSTSGTLITTYPAHPNNVIPLGIVPVHDTTVMYVCAMPMPVPLYNVRT